MNGPFHLIVTDTSPLITLALADALDVLLRPSIPVSIPDAVYVEATRIRTAAGASRNAAVTGRRRILAANWSAIWYLLSAFAVISYTENAVYVLFAAAGSWLGAFTSLTWLRRGQAAPAETRHNPT